MGHTAAKCYILYPPLFSVQTAHCAQWVSAVSLCSVLWAVHMIHVKRLRHSCYLEAKKDTNIHLWVSEFISESNSFSTERISIKSAVNIHGSQEMCCRGKLLSSTQSLQSERVNELSASTTITAFLWYWRKLHTWWFSGKSWIHMQHLFTLWIYAHFFWLDIRGNDFLHVCVTHYLELFRFGWLMNLGKSIFNINVCVEMCMYSGNWSEHQSQSTWK